MAEKQGLRPARVPSGWVELVKDGIEAPMRCSPKAVDYWKSRGWNEKPTEESVVVEGTKGAPTEPAEPTTAQRRGTTGKDA